MSAKFRFVRGSLEDSLSTETEVTSKEHLLEVIVDGLYLDSAKFWVTDIVINEYAFDKRIRNVEMTYIVLLKGCGPVGFINKRL